MKEILVLRCSPHAGGVSDSLAAYFAEGIAECAYPFRLCALRDYNFCACDGCGICSREPFKCKFEQDDNLSALYGALQNVFLLVIASPIYFYALPALCTAFIDRGQALWNIQKSQPLPFPRGLAIFAAARSRGPQLFKGASLCLSSFFNSLASSLLTSYAFRALENTSSLAARPEIKSFLRTKGRAWARYAMLNENL